MKPANFAPAYAALYAPLAELTREHGYALAVHGSMARDFDLVCIPWVDTPSSPDTVVEAITKRFAIQLIGEGKPKKHGRVAYTISIEFGECRLDLSFMPALVASHDSSTTGQVWVNAGDLVKARAQAKLHSGHEFPTEDHLVAYELNQMISARCRLAPEAA